MKKIFAVLFALMMVFTICTPVFAAEEAATDEALKNPLYIDFAESLLLMGEGMLTVIGVVAVIWGCVELLMLGVKVFTKKEKKN
ncbi:MAG: hypothetical protein E7332_04495 [Clostridiales bacterium]|nr:hypothetical protein [Clostridiales bacterium]